MLKEDRIELAKYRLEKAKDCLKASNILLDDSMFSDSANRSYYTIFHAINALLALEGVSFKKHSGVISHFNQKYVKTGIVEKDYGKIAGNAFEIRKDYDYADFYVVSKDEVIEQYENATRFVTKIEEQIKKEIGQ